MAQETIWTDRHEAGDGVDIATRADSAGRIDLELEDPLGEHDGRLRLMPEDVDAAVSMLQTAKEKAQGRL